MSQVEQNFRNSTLILMCVAIAAYFAQHFTGRELMRLFDLECALLSFILLLVNFKSWSALAQFITGTERSLKRFLFLKAVSLGLLALLLTVAQLRGMIIFLICLAVFLFAGSLLSLASKRPPVSAPDQRA